MSNLRYGVGDSPHELDNVWFASCSDGHCEVIYIAGVAGRDKFNRRGECPACAGAELARYEDQARRGEAP